MKTNPKLKLMFSLILIAIGAIAATPKRTSGQTNTFPTTGNVGIGTTTPQRTLDLSTSGQLTFGNNGYSSTGSPGLFWYSDNINYGIYKSAGLWNAPNYQQLMLNFPTGIVIDGGSAYGRSGTVLQPNGGNVGIGTTVPSDTLQVDSATGWAFRIGYTGNGQYLRMSANQISAFTASGGGTDFYLNTAGGNVGIGTTNAQYKLDVNGNTNVNGNITASGSIAAKYQDVAEWVPSSEKLPAGTVVVLDATKSNQVIASATSYDTRVAGVVSEQPGIALGEKSDSKVLVATTGRVRVKVDASRAPIRIGDLLVTSDIPGVAMKSEPVNLGGVQIHRPGTLIGKALESLEKGTGTILVLLSLQ